LLLLLAGRQYDGDDDHDHHYTDYPHDGADVASLLCWGRLLDWLRLWGVRRLRHRCGLRGDGQFGCPLFAVSQGDKVQPSVGAVAVRAL